MRVPLACAFMLGVAGGARTMLPAATVSRAVRGGTLCVKGTPLAFAEGLNLNRILAGLALAEIVADKLPMTPSRKATAAFAARVLSGALAGAAVGVVARRPTLGALLGMCWCDRRHGGRRGIPVRWLASLFDRDLPAAVIEDLVALALIGFVSSKLKDCAVPGEVSLA